MKQVFITISFFLFLPLLAQEVATETFRLENTLINIRVLKFGENGKQRLFLNVHENESTSVEAVKQYLRNRSGYFVTLKHDGKRNISFDLKGTKYQFDPNRMFTKEGRVANLRLLNRKYASKAEEKVEEFSDKIISKVKDASIVIALHNNTNGKPLSVNSYRNKYVNPSMDADDFVLTTEKSIFEQLKSKKINAVWETTSTSIDDGSLAYFCSKKGIPYINVEAQAGHKSQQLKMLHALTSIIDNYAE